MDAIRIQRKIAVISSLEELFPPRGTEGGERKKWSERHPEGR